jgi:hypothetical protein
MTGVTTRVGRLPLVAGIGIWWPGVNVRTLPMQRSLRTTAPRPELDALEGPHNKNR